MSTPRTSFRLVVTRHLEDFHFSTASEPTARSSLPTYTANQINHPPSTTMEQHWTDVDLVEEAATLTSTPTVDPTSSTPTTPMTSTPDAQDRNAIGMLIVSLYL